MQKERSPVPTTPVPATTSQNDPASAGFKKVLKRCLRLIRSTVGLMLILVAYSFAGAALFHYLEGKHEAQEKKDIVELRESIVDRIFYSSRNISINEVTWRDLVRGELYQYEGELYESFAHGVSTDSTIKQWDFWGSLLFCATVYTTIGYGHIAPATDAGRVCCILYAIIGIPLCLIVLADLGKIFTRGLKYLWSFVRRFYYTGRCAKKSEAAGATAAGGKSAAQSRKDAAAAAADVYVVDDEFNLPPIVAVLIAAVYILLGAVLYIQWEDWSYLEAFYFLFVSVSTIGFGDVLPAHPRYFLLTSLYVLVGLSLVAMVINVIMDSLTSTITRAKETVADVGKTIGLPVDILDDAEDEDAKKVPPTPFRATTPVINLPPAKNGTHK